METGVYQQFQTGQLKTHVVVIVQIINTDDLMVSLKRAFANMDADETSDPRKKLMVVLFIDTIFTGKSINIHVLNLLTGVLGIHAY